MGNLRVDTKPSVERDHAVRDLHSKSAKSKSAKSKSGKSESSEISIKSGSKGSKSHTSKSKSGKSKSAKGSDDRSSSSEGKSEKSRGKNSLDNQESEDCDQIDISESSAENNESSILTTSYLQEDKMTSELNDSMEVRGNPSDSASGNFSSSESQLDTEKNEEGFDNLESEANMPSLSSSEDSVQLNEPDVEDSDNDEAPNLEGGFLEERIAEGNTDNADVNDSGPLGSKMDQEVANIELVENEDILEFSDESLE